MKDETQFDNWQHLAGLAKKQNKYVQRVLMSTETLNEFLHSNAKFYKKCLDMGLIDIIQWEDINKILPTMEEGTS